MTKLLTLAARPVSLRRGLQLALIAVVMTASPWVATLWFAVAAIEEGYDYATSGVVYAITWPLAFLAVIPLLWATVALVGRPVKPSWLMPVAVALALCQPTFFVLNVMQFINLDIGTSLLLSIATGCSAGVVAAGLVGVDRSSSVGEALLVAVGVSAFMTALGGLLLLVALTIAILLAIAIRRGRTAEAP